MLVSFRAHRGSFLYGTGTGELDHTWFIGGDGGILGILESMKAMASASSAGVSHKMSGSTRVLESDRPRRSTADRLGLAVSSFLWETLAACRDPPEPPPVRYLEYIVRYGGVPGGSQHAAYRVNDITSPPHLEHHLKNIEDNRVKPGKTRKLK